MMRNSIVSDAIRARQLTARFRRTMLSGITRLVCVAGVAAVMVMGSFGIVKVEGNDMYPAIRDGDIAVYYRRADFMNSDVILYRFNDRIRCSRIEAVNGSVISKTGGGLITIDGNIQPAQERAGIYSETKAGKGLKLPYTVGSDEFFVLGDNRENACDSRESGCVLERDVLGKAFLVIRRRAI